MIIPRPNEIPTQTNHWKTRKYKQTSSENSPKMQFSNLQHSNSVKCLIYKRKTAVFVPAVWNGDPNEIRTRVTAVRGRCPRPLDDGTITSCQSITSNSQNMQALFRHKSAQAPITLNFRLQICLGYTINRIDKILLSTKIKKIWKNFIILFMYHSLASIFISYSNATVFIAKIKSNAEKTGKQNRFTTKSTTKVADVQIKWKNSAISLS